MSVDSDLRSEIAKLQSARSASWGRVNLYRLRAVLRHAGATVLDVGCSTGGYVEALAARGYRACGIDLLAEGRWQQGSRQGYVVGDSLALAFCDRAFDTVIAFEVLEHVRATQTGVITAQILSEFFVVATRKLVPPLTSAQAEAQLRTFSMQWPVLPITEAVVFLAARATQEHQMHFWDAQIWAAARLHGITHIYSEDFNPGVVIEGVRFVNPLNNYA